MSTVAQEKDEVELGVGNTLDLSIAAGRWQFLNMAAQQILTIGTFFILARLLVPADFGVVALIMIIPNFLEGVTTFSFDVAAMQKKEKMGEYLNVVWTFNIVRSALICVSTIIAAPFVASFFHIEYALPLLYIAGIGILIQSFFNIGQNYLFLDLNFKKLFLRDFFYKSSYAIAAILLALIVHSYWALFWANVISIICVTAITYAIHPFRPQFDFAFRKLNDLRHFSQWLYAQEMAGQLERSVGDAMIGRFATPADLGLFSKAKSLASAVISPVISNINKVSFSSYLHVRDSLPHISEGINKTLDILFAVGLPYVLVILLTGRRIVLIVLGPNWVSLASYLQVLAFSATLNGLTVILASAVFNGIGKPHIQSTIGMVSTGTTLAGFILLVPVMGIWGAVYASLFGSIVAATVTIYFMMIHIPLNLPRITWSFFVVLCASLLPIPLALYLLSLPFFNATLGYILLLAFSGSLYAAGIIGAGVFFKKGPYDTFVILVLSLLRAIRVKALSVTSHN